MNENEFKKKCEDMLALEQYRASLKDYRPAKKLKFGEELKAAGRSLLMLAVILVVIAALRFAQSWLKDRIFDTLLLFGLLYYSIFVFRFIGYIWILVPLFGGKEEEGVLEFLWHTLFMASHNKKIETANRTHETEVKLAEDAWETLQKELLDYSHEKNQADKASRNGRERKFFFDIPVRSIETEDVLMSKLYGITHWNDQLLGGEIVTEVITGCYGKMQTEENRHGEWRLDGITKAYEATHQNLRKAFTNDYFLLYADAKQEAPAEDAKLQIQKIYEIVARRLTETTTYTTTTSYDVKGALHKFNSSLDILENAGAIDITEANYLQEKGEKRIRDALQTTSNSRSTKRCVGEELLMLEKGYVVFLGDSLRAICLPRGKTEELHIVYELDKSVEVAVMDYEIQIPVEQRFHGKILLAESRKVHPNPYSTAQYAAEALGKFMKPFDASQELPDDMPTEAEMGIWRYFMVQRYKKESGKTWSRQDCEALVGKPETGRDGSPRK